MCLELIAVFTMNNEKNYSNKLHEFIKHVISYLVKSAYIYIVLKSMKIIVFKLQIFSLRMLVLVLPDVILSKIKMISYANKSIKNVISKISQCMLYSDHTSFSRQKLFSDKGLNPYKSLIVSAD